MKFLSKGFLTLLVLVILMVIYLNPIYSQEAPLGEPFKMGVLGTMSGEYAAWGLVNKYSVLAYAKLINDEGGFIVDGVRHKIEVMSQDDQGDPRVAIQGTEKLIYSDNVKYIVGPNVDMTASAILPIIEAGGAISISYSFNRNIFAPPHYNSMLGMIASFQSAPIMYRFMKENFGIKTISFLARNTSDSLLQREEGIDAAKKLGLEIISSDVVYEPMTSDYFPTLTKILQIKPDLLVLASVSPGEAPLIARSARQLGYEGYISTETSLDVKTLVEGAGEFADGFMYIGGASTPEIQSEYMDKFIKNYEDIAGEWNDEAGTKVYAPAMIIFTIQQAGKAALTDIEAFKEAMPYVMVEDPFIKESRVLKWVGEEFFGQKHQIGVPAVITQIKDGKGTTLFLGDPIK